jgi:hypothetical protein
MPKEEQSDRRQHVVYVTRHTEYHCRARECVGVRDRDSGRWQRWHHAVRSQLAGSAGDDAAIVWTQPQVGERLLFIGDGSILTSRLVGQGRPPKEALQFYSSFGKAGTIFA